MEFEERNPKPEKEKAGLPMAVLFVLIAIICLLLYAGWHLMSDDASKVSELKDKEVVEAPIVDSTTMITQAPQEATKVAEEAPNVNVPAANIESSAKAEGTVKTQGSAKMEVKETAKKVEEVKSVYKGETTSHLVQTGETVLGLGNRFNVSFSTLKKANPNVDLNAIKVGVTKLNIPIQTVHTVGPGDVLRVVAKKYDISLEALMAANGKTKNYAQRGEKLLIPLKK